MATLIGTDGSEREVKPAGKTFTLQELYQYTECDLVQHIHLADGRSMWVDEVGKYRRHVKLVNVKATMLLADAGGIPDDYVVGPVLITSGGEVV